MIKLKMPVFFTAYLFKKIKSDKISIFLLIVL